MSLEESHMVAMTFVLFETCKTESCFVGPLCGEAFYNRTRDHHLWLYQEQVRAVEYRSLRET